MVGAGILPTAWHKGKVWFLFGKENRFADTPGWSDFGGGLERGETAARAAAREGAEELTGFLGSPPQVAKLLKGAHVVRFGDYTMHLVRTQLDPALEQYYNRNAAFLHSRLKPETVKRYRIFEKSEIRWVPFEKLGTLRFRSYFGQMGVPALRADIAEIEAFVRGGGGRAHGRTRRRRVAKG